jgi:predicted RNA binding protein YcfA (HicA-like mRNA interferase family)
MPQLPCLSGGDVVKVFQSFGWSVARQRGSNIVMVKDGEPATLSIPDHREIAKGTMRSLIHSANLTIDQFLSSL